MGETEERREVGSKDVRIKIKTVWINNLSLYKLSAYVITLSLSAHSAATCLDKWKIIAQGLRFEDEHIDEVGRILRPRLLGSESDFVLKIPQPASCLCFDGKIEWSQVSSHKDYRSDKSWLRFTKSYLLSSLPKYSLIGDYGFNRNLETFSGNKYSPIFSKNYK